MKRTFAFCLVLAVSGSIAWAESPAPAPAKRSNWKGTIGGGIVSFPEYPGSEERRTLPLPFFSLEFKDRFFFGASKSGIGGGMGLHLYKTEAFAWSLGLDGGMQRNESWAKALAGMGDRSASVGLATGISYKMGQWSVSTGISRMFNNGGGTLAQVGLDYGGMLTDRVLGGWGISLSFGDRKNMAYDFGITASQAAKRHQLILAGDPRLHPGDDIVFSPKAGLRSASLGLMLGYVLNTNWQALSFAGFERLVGDAKRSPLVRKPNSFSLGIGVVRSF